MSDSELLVYIADSFVGIAYEDLNCTEGRVVTELCDNGYLHIKEYQYGDVLTKVVKLGREVSS